MKRIIIAGIDSGTTKAYALLDIKGNIIDIGSSKNSHYSDLILKITRYGKVYAIGSDVYPCPNKTLKISRIIGAKIIQPNHDLGYLEKIKMKDNFLKTKKEYVDLKNKHEKDALVAALYGLKKINSLIKKIDDHLKQNNKEHLIDEVIAKVLLENMPITSAVRKIS